MTEDFVDCMSCGESLQECSCLGCEVCGGKTCEHLQERANQMISALAQSLRQAGNVAYLQPRATSEDNNTNVAHCPFCGLPGEAIAFHNAPGRYGCRSCQIWSRDLETWNRRSHGPQTAAVLAELVELLINPDYGTQDPGEHVFVFGVRDREAFLKEQGMGH